MTIAVFIEEEYQSNDVYTSGRVAVYSVSSIIILSFSIVSLQLYVYYKYIK